MQRQEKSCDHRFTAGAVRRVDPAHRTGRYVLGAQRGVETSYLWSPGNGWFLFQGWSPGMACVYDVRRGGGWRSVARARYLDALGRNRAGSARRGSHHLASNRQGNRATTQRTPTLDVGIPRTGGMLIPRHLIGSSATGLAVPLSAPSFAG